MVRKDDVFDEDDRYIGDDGNDPDEGDSIEFQTR
jgi:hypothetical protein